MRDPFRPNSNNQLMREAQFAFVVILVLLGVLVYVAFHRVAGRKFHFRQMAQSAPLAQHVDDNAYPAQAIIEHEEREGQDTLSTTKSVARPNHANQTIPKTKPAPTQTFSPRQKPAPSANRPQPTVSAAAEPVFATGRVAQAQFIVPPKSKPAFNPPPQKQLPTSQPAVDNPFEKIKPDASWPNPASSVVPIHSEKGSEGNHDSAKSKPLSPEDSSSDFRPPLIKSNFGAGSIRELPSFDSPIKKEPTKEASTSTPTSTPTLTSPRLSPKPKPKQTKISSFVPTPKEKPNFVHSFNSRKNLEADVVKKENPKTKPRPKPQPLGLQEHKVQTTDSLWSIAMEHYGDGRFFRALHKHNLDRINSADRLEPNTTIDIPNVDQLIRRYPELCPADKLSVNSISSEDQSDVADPSYDLYEKNMDERFHITQTGDTLFDVARQRLGQASRYLEIFELNRFRIPQHANHLTPLHPGLRLLLPE